MLVGDTCEVINETHSTDNIKGVSWKVRARRVEKYLALYQNAKYVVTRRLHVALPCLAMGVPVMCIQGKNMNDPNRFDPYKKWLHFCNNNEFLQNGYPGFDFVNGTPNKKDYLLARNELIGRIKTFIEYCESNADKDATFFNRRSYTEAQKKAWQASFLRKILNRTHVEAKAMQQQLVKLSQSAK